MRGAPRCLLFVPGHVAKLRAKALGLKVDATVLDLEDAVPRAEKEAARQGSSEYVQARPGHAFVRINPLTASTPFSTGCGHEDIIAIVQPGLRGVVVPKVESPADVAACDAAITAAEMRNGVSLHSTELYLILETARGVSDAVSIARASTARPRRLCFGAGDFTTDIGVDWTREEEESKVARALIVMASRVAGLEKPIDSVFADIADGEGLRRNTLLGKQLGFCAKFVIHPSQIETVSAVFTPSADEVAWARLVIEKLAEAERSGAGAFVVNGKMIDYPIVEKARGLIRLWEEIQSRRH